MRKKKEKPAADDELKSFTVRLRPSIIRRTQIAATLLELPVQTVASLALDHWLTEHEATDQATLLIRHAKLKKAVDDATRKVFERLCTHARANGINSTMTREELWQAAGLMEREFMAVLRSLRGPGNDQDREVIFVGANPDKIKLGLRWRQECGVKEGK